MASTTDLIRKLTERGLTQTEIAKRTGIPQPRLSRWAAGDVPQGADDALKLQQLVLELQAQPEGASHAA